MMHAPMTKMPMAARMTSKRKVVAQPASDSQLARVDPVRSEAADASSSGINGCGGEDGGGEAVTCDGGRSGGKFAATSEMSSDEMTVTPSSADKSEADQL